MYLLVALPRLARTTGRVKTFTLSGPPDGPGSRFWSGAPFLQRNNMQ